MAYQSEVEKLTAQWNAKPEQYFAPLADAYRKAGDIDMALEVVRAGLAKRPNYLSAHIVLGRCFLDQKNDVEAAKAFQKVLEFDAENIIALRVLGEIGERSGDLDSAHKWIKRLLEVDPMNDDAQEALKRLEPAVRPLPVTAEVAPSAPAAPEPAGAPAALSGFEPTSFSAVPTTEVPAVKAPPRQSRPVAAQPGGDVLTLDPAEPAMPDLSAMSAVSSLGVERAESALEAGGPTGNVERMVLESNEPTAPPPPATANGSGLELAEEMNLTSAPSAEFETSMDAMAPPPPAPAAAGPELIPLDEPEAPSAPLPLMDFSEPTPAPAPAQPAVPEPVAPRSSRSFRAPSGMALIMPDDPAPAPAPAPPPPPVAVPEAIDGPEPEPVITETMAEVYLKQGLVHEAREVYRKLVEQRPADAGLRSRLAALEQRVSASQGAAAAARPRYAAAETGGQPARSLLAQVLASRPTPSTVPDSGSPGATLNAAFANEPPAGAPTSPAADELSLASVFGEEPAPAPVPQPAAAAPAAPGFSFDEFFGGKKAPPAAPAAPAPAPPTEAEGTPSDFLSWLKGLKS